MSSLHLRKRLARQAACIVSVLGAGVALAQPYTTPPPPAAPRPLAIAAPSETRLPNGRPSPRLRAVC